MEIAFLRMDIFRFPFFIHQDPRSTIVHYFRLWTNTGIAHPSVKMGNDTDPLITNYLDWNSFSHHIWLTFAQNRHSANDPSGGPLAFRHLATTTTPKTQTHIHRSDVWRASPFTGWGWTKFTLFFRKKENPLLGTRSSNIAERWCKNSCGQWPVRRFTILSQGRLVFFWVSIIYVN